MWGMGLMGRWMSGYGVMGYGAGFGILALLAVLVGRCAADCRRDAPRPTGRSAGDLEAKAGAG